jgi:hypothetical protein
MKMEENMRGTAVSTNITKAESKYPMILNFRSHNFRYTVEWADRKHLFISAIQVSEPQKVYSGSLTDFEDSRSSI